MIMSKTTLTTTTMTDIPGPSTPNSRKRSKWDITEDSPKDTAHEYGLIKKRPKIKNLRQHEPVVAPEPVSSSSRNLSHSKYVPPRTHHPALAPSRFVHCYERLNQIEEGTYGVVFRARDKQTGDIVALKRLKLDEEKYGFPITSLREINALIACRHENVVGIREVVVGDTLTQCVRRCFFLGPDRKASHRFNTPTTTNGIECSLSWTSLSMI